MDWLVNAFTTPTMIQAVIILSIVSAVGLYLGKIKIFGVSLGITFVFFAGILVGHLGIVVNKDMKKFLLLLCLTLSVVACSKEDSNKEEAIIVNNPLPKEPQELKILAIGNSFTEDATQYLPSILSAAHIKNVTIARLLNGGLSLENHWNYYSGDSTSYFYQKTNPETNMWLILAFISAFLLGCYEVNKKFALTNNAVIPILFLNTLISSLIFVPFIVLSVSTHWLDQTVFYVPHTTFATQVAVFIKAIIVLSSWIFGYFGMKHLPLTITGPIKATQPVLTLVGALVIFGERLNLDQWIGVILSVASFYMNRPFLPFSKNASSIFPIA